MNKGINRMWKRITSVLVTFCLVAAMALSPLSMAAYAAGTELPNEDLGWGSSSSTGYDWVGPVRASGAATGVTPTRHFDITGLKKDQKGYNTSGIKTTYGFFGYDSRIRIPSQTTAHFINTPYNGGVDDIGAPYNMEVRIALSPSPDNKYVFADYYVYNKSSSTVRDVLLGTGTDIMVGGDDSASLYKNARGFHMLNKKGTNIAFDCITDDSALDITGTTTRWLGDWKDWSGNMFKESAASKTQAGVDSGFAYSWKFDLRPYELVHRRVAFSVKDRSYYVKQRGGSDLPEVLGTNEDPFATIEHALSKIGNEKGYVLLMDDYDLADASAVTIAEGQDITFSSTDYDTAMEPIKVKYTLKRAVDSTVPLFNVTGGSLSLEDIVLDGNGAVSAEPMLSVTGGTLGIDSNTTITNCHGSALSKGSTVNVTGDGVLSMNLSQVSGNISEGKGAIYFDGSEFHVKNKVTVQDNTSRAGTKANVYLADGKVITVDGDLEDSKIGVTTAKNPDASLDGAAKEPGEEIKVAVPGKPADWGSPSPFADNFLADRAGEDNVALYKTYGTDTLSADNDKNTVLRKHGQIIRFNQVNTEGKSVSRTGIPQKVYGYGDEVHLAAPPVIGGYTLDSVTVDQGLAPTLTVNEAPGEGFGKIDGTMPAQDVAVSYTYAKGQSRIKFDTKGGMPQPPELTGTEGTPIPSTLPSISKYGWVFDGWSESDAWGSPTINKFPIDGFPTGETIYHAMYRVDTSININCKVEHTNDSGSLEFKLPDEPWQIITGNVETHLDGEKKNIKNYIWSKEDSGITPGSYNYRGASEAVGRFGDDGRFTGKMPGQDATLSYRYKVDYTKPKLPLTVRHESIGGVQVAGTQTAEHFPEEAFTVSPSSVYGYECTGYTIEVGESSGDTAGGYVYPVTGTADENYAYAGTMPNQPVTLVYHYKTTIPGYGLTVGYEDTLTRDPRLKNIIEPVNTGSHEAGSSVNGEYAPQYGYHVSSGEADAGLTVRTGSDWGWSGTMPNNNAKVTYKLDRDAGKWVQLTYKSGADGALAGGEGMSPDVQPVSAGSYKVSVLRSDGTDSGREKAYTLKQIRENHLMPEAVAAQSQYYQFDGWCLEGRDEVLPDDYQFTADTTVTAHYGEKPGAWVTVNFAAGDHGSFDSGRPAPIHTMSDKNWSDIWTSLPASTPQQNYLVKGWFDEKGNKLAQHSTEPLEDGQTYTIRFYPDPAVFGTDVSAPNAASSLNTGGKGRITVYGTTPSYQYLLADSGGKVLLVNRGSLGSSRTMFDDLYPGMEYTVYEAVGDTAVGVGDRIAGVSGLSAPATVLTPVMDENYKVEYDEDKEGKTTLIINPADPASDYALVDKNGNPVNTPQTGGGGWQKPSGKPAQLSFTGLDYNGKYTVVARPAGQTEITAADCEPYGSVISTDPGGELELTNYMIIAQNAAIESVGDVSVRAESWNEAHAGDLVKLKAEPTKGENGRFSHWEFTIGSVKGLKSGIKTPELSFAMPETNLVLTAVYSYPGSASPSNAKVAATVRGGSREELALDPNEIPDLEDSLTTPGDKTLLDVNKADVTYKVVYRKNVVKASESNAVRNSGDYVVSHEKAYKGAWGLDVSVERYVNGRQVPRATASNASFKTYVQLDKKDVDMKDYQLYEFRKGTEGGEVTISLVSLSEEPEETGGLFSFEAAEGSRYVMVYNRAYPVYFFNNTAPAEDRYRRWLKVRRDEAPSASYYTDQLNDIMNAEQLPHFSDSSGAEYNYMGWSYRENKLNEFDPDKVITRKTKVYAYYENNLQDVNDARERLEAALKAAVSLSDDHFLKVEESQRLAEFIYEVQDILDWKLPDHEPASQGALETAISDLDANTAPFKNILKGRYSHYGQIKESGHKGGSSGGGGGGAGTKSVPFNNIPQKDYRIGTNGSWVETTGPAGEKHRSFQLNGGNLLTGMWARLEYPGETQSDGNGWYRFDSRGRMETGWLSDEKGNWYYCNTEKDGNAGRMATDWRLDGSDGKWYYLDPNSGATALGWREIRGKWYYFSPVGGGAYTYDPATENWNFGGGSGRPLGSMYKNEETPDGYRVDANGAWIQ